jgi:glutamyl-tRNA synthetase
LPIHIELFDLLGFRRPKYGHNCSLQKMDGETRRKLSKRKDPELSLEFYRQEGYYARAVKVYMLTLLNSNFEEWYMKNPDGALEDFKFSINKMGKSGALFDLNKLSDISKNELAKLSAEEMYDFLKEWTEEFGTDTQKGYFTDREYLLKILTLCMGIGGKKRRKDFTTAKQAMEFIAYFFDETFAPAYEYRFDAATVKAVLSGFAEVYDYADDCSAWFEKVKAVAAANGFATDMKAYKADPTAFPGNVSDVAEMLRIATTGLANTPDLWTIMQILGNEKTLARLDKAIKAL